VVLLYFYLYSAKRYKVTYCIALLHDGRSLLTDYFFLRFSFGRMKDVMIIIIQNHEHWPHLSRSRLAGRRPSATLIHPRDYIGRRTYDQEPQN
jgi:hypothetical protein